MENAASFLNKLAEDNDLQAALVAATETAQTKEERIAATTKVANDAGFNVSAEELQKLIEGIQAESDRLSDDDLDNVAGGVAAGTVIAAVDLAHTFGIDKKAWNFAKGPGKNWTTHAAKDTASWTSNAAKDTANWTSNAASDVGNAVSNAFSGW